MLQRSIFILTAALVLGGSLSAEEVQGLVLPIKQVQVASPVLQEVVEAVLIEEGDAVTEGQVIVQLRQAKEELAVQESEKLIENLEFVSKGAEALFNEKMGSREQALKAKTELELGKIRRALANEQLREKTIRAPLSGVVVKKYKEAGESVDRVEKIVDIVNIDQVIVQFYLDPKYMPTLKEGQAITVKFPVLNNVTFDGKLDFIDPRIDAGSGLFRIKVLIDNPDHRIKAGMRGTATFQKV